MRLRKLLETALRIATDRAENPDHTPYYALGSIETLLRQALCEVADEERQEEEERQEDYREYRRRRLRDRERREGREGE